MKVLNEFLQSTILSDVFPKNVRSRTLKVSPEPDTIHQIISNCHIEKMC